MELAALEAQKEMCKDLDKQIQMVIEGGIFDEHKSILQEAVEDYLADYPEYRYLFLWLLALIEYSLGNWLKN